jgi:hypothetical protein
MGGSAGGFYKRFAAPAIRSLPDFWTFMAQIYYFTAGYEKKSKFCIFFVDFLEVRIPITYNLRYLTHGGG